jgi:hypothetical protein
VSVAHQRVPRVKVMSRLLIEERALLHVVAHQPCALEPGAPVDSIALFDRTLPRLGLNSLVVKDLPGIEGFTQPSKRLVAVGESVYAAAEANEPRPRFTVAHEVSHGILHVDQLADRHALFTDFAEEGAPLFRRSDLNACVDPEYQANSCASALLMPLPRVLRLVETIGDTDQRCRAMMRVFVVSKSAAQARLGDVDRRASEYRRLLQELGL